MAFKTAEQYNEERYGNMLTLKDDGDFVDVIPLYRNSKDVLVGDTHYIKSSEYSGYVHCNGKGCAACQKGIRVQTKLFIPLYDIKNDAIVFFDRSIRFEPQLQREVFANYPDPCNFVFRLTRHGEAGSIDTTYQFQVQAKNNLITYDELMAKFQTSFPEFYNDICKEVDNTTLQSWLNNNGASASELGDYTPADMPNYTVKPRVSAESQPAVDIAESLDNIDVETEEESLEDGDEPNF